MGGYLGEEYPLKKYVKKWGVFGVLEVLGVFVFKTPDSFFRSVLDIEHDSVVEGVRVL